MATTIYIYGSLIIVGLIVLTRLGYLRYASIKIRSADSQLNEVLEKLEEREKTLSLIYENSSDFIALLKKEGVALVVVQLPEAFLHKIETHTPYKREDVIGAPLSFLYTEVLGLTAKEKKMRNEKLNEVIQHGKAVKYEEYFKNPDGTRGWSNSSLTPILKNGRIDYVLYVAHDITIEKSAEEKLKFNLSLLENVIDYNQAAIVLFENGLIKRVNKRFLEYFGYEREEIIGQKAESIVPVEHWAGVQQVRQDIYNSYTVYQYGRDERIQLKRKDGTLFYTELSICALPIEEARYSILSITDVSEHYRVQNELIQSKEQLQSIIDNLPGMFYRLNTDEEFTLKYISGNSETYLGISNEEVKKHNLRARDIIPEEYILQTREKLAEVLHSGVGDEITVPINYKGISKWMLTRFKPTKLSNGELVVDGLLFDVTEQVENKERLSLAIESAEEGILDWRVLEQVIYFNDYHAAMLGFEPTELDNSFNTFYKRIHPEDMALANEQFKLLFESRESHIKLEYRVKAKSGLYKWLLLHAKVITTNQQKRPTRIIGTHIDIDERKKAELAIKKSQARLLTLMSNLPGMVYRSTLNDRFSLSFVSQGSLGLTGYTAEEMLKNKLTVFELIKDTYKENVRRQVEIAVKNNEPYKLFYEIETPSGPKWVYDRGQEIEKGYLEGFIIDVTDRVEAEERIIQTIIETEDKERKRIAKELHDSLGQKLTTVSLNFNSLKGKLGDEEVLNERLQNGLLYLTQAIKETREISHNLMPRSIEDFGLLLSVESLVADLNVVSDTQFNFYHNLGQQQIASNIGLHLYRITQEAINNIIKYAQAKTATIQLMLYNDVIILSIEDDGLGFDLNKMEEHSQFGLESIRHRAQILSSQAIIDSHPGKGTSITIEIPFKSHYIVS